MARLVMCLYFCFFASAVRAEPPPSAAVSSIVTASEGHFEYTPDGAGTIGFISGYIGTDTVKFTTCNDHTEVVRREHLRPTEAVCDRRDRGPDSPFWPLGVTSVYKSKDDESGTVVEIRGKKVDLKNVKGWPTAGLSLSNERPHTPVGYVFTDSDGSKAIAILEGDSASYDGKPKDWKGALHQLSPGSTMHEGD